MAFSNPFSNAAILTQLAAINSSNAAVFAALTTLINQGHQVMLNVTALTAQVKKNTDVEASALVLIQGFAASQAQLSAQLAAAIAANDPVALAAAQKVVDDSVTALTKSDDELAAAVAANTAAPPAAGGPPSS